MQYKRCGSNVPNESNGSNGPTGSAYRTGKSLRSVTGARTRKTRSRCLQQAAGLVVSGTPDAIASCCWLSRASRGAGAPLLPRSGKAYQSSRQLSNRGAPRMPPFRKSTFVLCVRTCSSGAEQDRLSSNKRFRFRRSRSWPSKLTRSRADQPGMAHQSTALRHTLLARHIQEIVPTS